MIIALFISTIAFTASVQTVVGLAAKRKLRRQCTLHNRLMSRVFYLV